MGDIYLIHKQTSIPTPETGWGRFTFFEENLTEIIKLRILSWRGCSGLAGWAHPQGPHKYPHMGETKGKDPDKRGQGDSMKQREKGTSQRLWQMPEGMSPTVSREQGLAGSFFFFHIPGFQYHRMTPFSALKPPSLWRFVTVTPGHWYTRMPIIGWHLT